MHVQTQLHGARMRGWLDSLGLRVRNAFNSFVVPAPKITLLSTKTINSTSISTPAALHLEISVGGSPLVISDEPSAPSSCVTARDMLTHGNKRRRLFFQPLPPIAEEEDSVKIPVCAAIVALRLAISLIDEQGEQEIWEFSGVHWPPTSSFLRRLRESQFRINHDAVLTLSQKRSRRLSLPSLSKAVELTFPPQIPGHHFKRKDRVRRSSM